MSTVSTITTSSPAETRALGARLATVLEPGDVILLVGDLGAGKTELAKGVAQGLGVEETVVSPTFTLAREYEGRLPMVHADAYRLEHGREVVDLDVQERDDAVTLIEWGNAVTGALGIDEYLEVSLKSLGDDEREVTTAACGPSWQTRIALLGALGP